jgi:tetratricopeptide (TPR) repeat protein
LPGFSAEDEYDKLRTNNHNNKLNTMKKIIFLLLAACSFQLTAFSQSAAYQQKMKETLDLMDSAKTTQDLQEVSAQFERIGDMEKSQWLPYYYSALAQVNIGWRDEKADKDKLAAKTKGIIAKAEAIEKSAELYVLLNMVATQQMMVDPQSRWMTYGQEAAKALDDAKKIDPNNPRIYYLEGMSAFNTPAAFGGGKDKARPIFEKAVKLYKNFKAQSAFHPKWGQKIAEDMLAKCSS